ncbi:hypothetical protein [Desulfobacter vibrioformis]|uniref:hypothetical protein n=1 Tax=Desulfobacter vibrioformis TaxID=34031 RepID=UPI000554B623|nr:hypothetical protein [Desulfobacter vibrioformis]
MAFAAIGGVVGAVIGGTTATGTAAAIAMAAVQGAAIGMALGSMVDVAVAGTPNTGSPEIQDLSFNTADEGLPIPEGCGCTKAYGNIFWVGESYST